MLRRLSVVCVLVAMPVPAHAQFSAYWFPVEKGFVDTHADLQLQYSRLTEEVCTINHCDELTINAVVLSLEAQHAIADRFEVGLNIPFMVRSWGTFGPSQEEDTNFGNMILNLKGKVFGTDFLSVSAFVNTLLPTHSGEGNHDFAMMFIGGAVGGRFIGIELGAALQGTWLILGDSDDVAFFGLDFYGGYKLFGVLSLTLAFQYLNSIHPDTSASPFALTPGIEVNPIGGLRAGVGCRIAVNDDARYLYIGRASLLFHGGYAF
jgi:hypothetical protein